MKILFTFSPRRPNKVARSMAITGLRIKCYGFKGRHGTVIAKEASEDCLTHRLWHGRNAHRNHWRCLWIESRSMKLTDRSIEDNVAITVEGGI